ncbi:NAD(P)-dependent oxidoreductase [Thioclava sp. SK-1]|uniref:SDR family oxidoreductase n=1 Tax=Thioclava sp. SK-1 TaxID=1889770 RepID=UPI0008270F77|nr:SDR family oxidoreductase [Thioclava sp. SK-1]OCX65786.1 NAD(P)-dependent oxidoreductase [Thioclava sp. SK-1]
MNTLLSIGHGFSAQAIARPLLAQGWRVIGTTRSDVGARALRDSGVEPVVWTAPGDAQALPWDQVTHVLSSVAPERGDHDQDPVLACAADAIATAPGLQWLGYLSTVGVYGDRQGGWVDEMSQRLPATRRGLARLHAEDAWAALGQRAGVPAHLFRLAGIYGPGRGPFEKVRNGQARIINKPGQVFSRIHVEDIAQVVVAAMGYCGAQRVWNLCDDCPIDPGEVLSFAAQLLGLPRPPVVEFDTADMSPMARSFYSESKRVRNDRIKSELGVTLHYPDYRAGLQALMTQER